jgi:hypothetical protein
MMAEQARAELIGAVQRAVDETLAYFEGAGRGNPARIDRWGAWEVLAHFPYWHEATAWGIRSGALGGPPWLLSGSADEINDACLALREGESFDDLVRQLREATRRLVRAAEAATDLEAPAFATRDGRTVSVRARLETIARHWRSHLQALKDAEATAGG